MALPAALSDAQMQGVIAAVAVGDTLVVRWSNANIPLGTYWTGTVTAKTAANATAGTPGVLRVDYGEFGSAVVFPPPAHSAAVHSVTHSAQADPYGDGYAKAMGGRAQVYDPFNVATWGLFIEAGNESARRTQFTVLMRELRTTFDVPTTGRLDKRSYDKHQVNNLLLIVGSWVLGAQTAHAAGVRRWDVDADLAIGDAIVAALATYHVKWNQGSVTEFHSHLEKDGGGIRGRVTEAVRLGLAKKGDAATKADKVLGLIA